MLEHEDHHITTEHKDPDYDPALPSLVVSIKHGARWSKRPVRSQISREIKNARAEGYQYYIRIENYFGVDDSYTQLVFYVDGFDVHSFIRGLDVPCDICHISNDFGM